MSRVPELTLGVNTDDDVPNWHTLKALPAIFAELLADLEATSPRQPDVKP